MSETFAVPCPHCGKEVAWREDNLYRPFCSKRCQIIDLGDWASEKNAIPTETADFANNPSFDENQDWSE